MVEVDATLCPICDEACTCPKPSLLVAVKGSTNNSSPSHTSNNGSSKKTPSKKPRPQNKRPAVPVPVSSSEDDCNSSNESADEADQALSFIKMIYSEEESLDEEEAYALFQATQLFSSSSEDEEYFYYQQQQQKFLEEYQKADPSAEGEDEDDGVSGSENEEDEDASDSDEENSLDDFAYTVVEYVNPIRPGLNGKKPTASEQVIASPAIEASKDEAQSNDWTTWSVFDATDDSEIITIQTNLSPSVLSSTGSGTPETLLFSTSSADKIPNIAPQVLAAISAAAKSMAAGGTSQAATRYFSYITTVAASGDSPDAESGEGEFLFFEEGDGDLEASDEEDEEHVNISLSDYDSLSESEEADEDDSVSVSSVDSFERDTFTSSMNRWNRVPIGTFRRSRRLSVPRAIHPSLAMKAATDPSSVTLTAPLLIMDASAALDHPCELQRAYSVITLDELNIDISNKTATSAETSSHCTQTNCFQCSSPVWPAPKRSKTVIPATNNSSNPDWTNWHWEI